MFRAALTAVFLLISNVASAQLPSAPFSQQAVEEIAEYWNATYPAFESESDQYNAGTPESVFVLAYYLKAAFEDAGYSLDETLYTYLSESNPGAVQMHQFAQSSGLGAVILGLDSAEKAAFLVNGELLSRRTFDYLQKLDKAVPVSEANYILEGSQVQGLSGEGVVREEFRDLGRLRLGEDEWEGWVVFKAGELTIRSDAIGLVDLRTVSQDYRDFVMSIVDQKKYLKIQGVTVRVPGSLLEFDDTQDVLIQFVK